MRLIQDLPGDTRISQGDDAVAQFQADFAEQTTDLFRGTYNFIARGVLPCKLTHSVRSEQLTALGFQLVQHRGLSPLCPRTIWHGECSPSVAMRTFK